jgi:hypothetical protein
MWGLGDRMPLNPVALKARLCSPPLPVGTSVGYPVIFANAEAIAAALTASK